MKKIIILSTLAISSAYASHFKSYEVHVINHSGGIVTVTSKKNISNLPSKLTNNKDYTVRVMEMNAHASFLTGPEDQKTKQTIQFCMPKSGVKTVVLKAKSIEATGFETKCDPFGIQIVNKSGGIATVLKDSNTSLTKNIAIKPNAVVKPRVQPGASAQFRTGPEGDKRIFEIVFGTKTGDNPQVTLQKGGLFTGNASAEDIIIQSRSVRSDMSSRRKAHKQSTKQTAPKRKMSKYKK